MTSAVASAALLPFALVVLARIAAYVRARRLTIDFELERGSPQEAWLRCEAAAPPVTLLVPILSDPVAADGAATQRVGELLSLDFPGHELVVVTIGGSAGVLHELLSAYRLRPESLSQLVRRRPDLVAGVYGSNTLKRLTILDIDPAGLIPPGRGTERALLHSALDCALGFVRTPLVAAIEPDVVLADDALLHAVEPFLSDDHNLAASHSVALPHWLDHRPASHARVPSAEAERPGWVARMQAIERIGIRTVTAPVQDQDRLPQTGYVDFTLWRRTALIAMGGFAGTADGPPHPVDIAAGAGNRQAFCPSVRCRRIMPDRLGTALTERLKREAAFAAALRRQAAGAIPAFLPAHRRARICQWEGTISAVSLLAVLMLAGVGELSSTDAALLMLTAALLTIGPWLLLDIGAVGLQVRQGGLHRPRARDLLLSAVAHALIYRPLRGTVLLAEPLLRFRLGKRDRTKNVDSECRRRDVDPGEVAG